MEKSVPFFSVVIPTYNRARMIAKAIESVLEQEFDNWELIIVDDGSTDNTKEVISKYTDGRIRYIYQDNTERSAARNNGINKAHGKYICFLDSDDYFLKDHLSSFYKTLEKNDFPEALLYCGFMEGRGDQLTPSTKPHFEGLNKVEEILLATVASQRVCIHSEILKEYQYDTRFRIAEDSELWSRIVEHYPLIYSDHNTVVINVHEERTVDFKNIFTYTENIELYQHIFDRDLNGQIGNSVRKQILGKAYFALGRSYEVNTKYLSMTGALLRSVLLLPSHRTKEKFYMIFRHFWLTKWLLKN